MTASLNGLAEDAFGHGAAANVACANKQDGLHQKVFTRN
jgi:hypothetical protein